MSNLTAMTNIHDRLVEAQTWLSNQPNDSEDQDGWPLWLAKPGLDKAIKDAKATMEKMARELEIKKKPAKRAPGPLTKQEALQALKERAAQMKKDAAKHKKLLEKLRGEVITLRATAA